MGRLDPHGIPGSLDQHLPDVRAELVETASAQIGNANTVTGGPYGDSGDWVPLHRASVQFGNLSTTSTKYAEVGNRAIVPETQLTSITNVSTLGYSFAMRVDNDTAGETTYARLYDRRDDKALTATEVSTTGTGDALLESPIEESVSSFNVGEYVFQMKVSGGTGTIKGYAPAEIWVWGKLA